MGKIPKYLMTKKELAEYVKYCTSGSSEDSKALFLQQFKYRNDEANANETCLTETVLTNAEITLEGCDDSTVFTVSCSESELKLLKEIADEANQASEYYCQPRMYVKAVD